MCVSPGPLVHKSPCGSCGRKATLNSDPTEFRSCVNVEVAVPNNPHGPCGRKATLNSDPTEFRSCVNVEVAVLGSPSLIILMVPVDVKQH